MALSSGVLDSVTKRVLDAQESLINDLSAVVENSRWLATLALAEIAGIATYRDLTDRNNLSVPFAISVIMLSVAILAFIVAVLEARKNRLRLHWRIQEITHSAVKFHNDGAIAPDAGDKNIRELAEKSLGELGQEINSATFYETAGLSLLGFATVFSGVVLLLIETWSTFWGWLIGGA